MPLALADKRIITLDLPAMVAGTKYRGDFEERIRSIMEEVAAAGDVILLLMRFIPLWALARRKAR